MKVYTLVQETRDYYDLLNTRVVGAFSSKDAVVKRIMEMNPNAKMSWKNDDCTMYEGEREMDIGHNNIRRLFYTWTIHECDVID